MIDILGLYSDQILPASYAGIPFWLVDSRDDPGRRVQRFLFPGQDQADFEDLGADDGEIHISALYVGDDYTNVANRLRAAFQTPGPATLQHPWLGELLVIQAPGKRPEFSFTQDEYRVLRFTASFCLYAPPPPPAPDTLFGLLAAMDDLRSQAAALLGTVLAPIAITLAAIGYVESFAGAMVSVWTGAIGAAEALVATAAALPIAALGLVNELTLDATYPGAVASTLGAVSAAIGGTTTPVMPAAVAPGGSTAAPVAVDGRTTATMILTAVTAMATHAADPAAAAPTVSCAAQMLAIADAVSATSDIAFTSQQEAQQWLTTLSAALTVAATQAALLAAAQPTAGGASWRALVAAQAALSADMTATIGRLPAVTTFTAPTSVPVWLLAQYLSGDNPSGLVATYLDLVGRNGIRNPAVAPAGALEVLLQ